MRAVLRCERCAERLDPATAEYLELDTHTGTFYRCGDVAPERSQGCFPFGKRCAEIVLGSAGVNRQTKRRRLRG